MDDDVFSSTGEGHDTTPAPPFPAEPSTCDHGVEWRGPDWPCGRCAAALNPPSEPRIPMWVGMLAAAVVGFLAGYVAGAS
jgi:hypothetical protein